MNRIWAFMPLSVLAGCSNIAVLNPKSTTGKEQAYLIWFGLGIMSLVLLTVFFLFGWVVSKYRDTNSKKGFIPKEQKDNIKLELIWIIIPFILLAILAVPTISITYHQSPVAEAEASPGGIHINVLARQFEWTFTYDNGKKEHNILVLPEGERVVLHLASADVIHSFWVPELAGKVDLIPGKDIVYTIENPEKGVYSGKCAEYCGIQHTNMVFEVRVLSKSEYSDYINTD